MPSYMTCICVLYVYCIRNTWVKSITKVVDVTVGVGRNRNGKGWVMLVEKWTIDGRKKLYMESILTKYETFNIVFYCYENKLIRLCIGWASISDSLHCYPIIMRQFLDR